jgi:aspartokinase
LLPTMGSLTYSNRSDYGWVVQKFGGTSVGKFPDKVCTFPTESWREGRQTTVAEDAERCALTTGLMLTVSILTDCL